MRAQANAERAADAMTAFHASVAKAFDQTQDPRVSPRKGLALLREIAARWSATLTPFSACRKGCSHCCHIGVAISPLEAELMGEAIGVRPRHVSRLSWNVRQPAGSRPGEACPFLREGQCSIYAHRPLMCRTLVNLDDDETQCRLDETRAVAYADARALQAVYLRLSGSPRGMADIRAFFPKGRGRAS